MNPLARPTVVEPGTPLAAALAEAEAARAQANAGQVDAAFRAAVEAAAPGGERDDLWLLLAADHVAALRALGSLALALRRCDHYLTEAAPAGAGRLVLWLERAELRLAVGDAQGAGVDARAVRAAVRDRAAVRGGTAVEAGEDELPDGDRGRLLRVEALAAADEGDLATAERLLDAAAEAFGTAGDDAGTAVIDRDRALLAVREGLAPYVTDVVAAAWPETVAGRFRLALALRRQLRYEEAAQVMLDVVANPDLDLALRLPALSEMAALLLALRSDRAAQALRPALDDATAHWPDPVAAASWVADLLSAGGDPPAGPGFARAVRRVQRLTVEGRLDEAELEMAELAELAVPPPLAQDRAVWCLAAGELSLARHQRDRQPRLLQEAVEHLGQAVEHASPAFLTEVRIRALRLLGEARSWQLDHGEAVALWAQAHRLEEAVASRQISDAVRVTMLRAVADEHDERVRLAARATAEDEQGAAAVPALVVAMEAARGAAILGRILPEPGLTRDLPPPGDHDRAWRWIRATADRLPRAQVVWMLHATPHQVHHAVIGRDLLHHAAIGCPRDELGALVDELMASWHEDVLESPAGRAAFSASTRRIATRIGIGDVLRHLPDHVRRIAIVAGGVLADVPFAALPVPGRRRPLGLLFALSDLPCLSARRPLQLRSARHRGDHHLLVSPPADGIARARASRGADVLEGPQATPGALRDLCRPRQHTRDRRTYHQIRVDCHGQYDADDPARHWLQLAPAGPAGRLHPEDLRAMDLGGCGTLILGACESGMATRVGRDERVGFVRAGIQAGAASVLAARWVTQDAVAASVLDRFQRDTRRLPRDLALQRALRAVYDGAPGAPLELPDFAHPARWACWTLYGDPGWQTGAGKIRRFFRRGPGKRG